MGVVLAGDVAGVAACGFAAAVAEGVPNAGHATVGSGEALQLIGGGGGAPDETGAEIGGGVGLGGRHGEVQRRRSGAAAAPGETGQQRPREAQPGSVQGLTAGHGRARGA